MPDFGVVFQEAIDFLRERLAMSPAEWVELIAEVDAAARDRSAGMSDALARDILEAIEKALEEGTTEADFRKTFDQLTRARGWTGDNTEGWRSTLTFRVLTSQALAAGRWRQIQRLKHRRPWLRYVTAGDHRVRPAHAAWHNVILPVDDPWWQTHFPPNGFNCRCHVQSLNDRDLVRYQLTPSEQAPALNPVVKIIRVDGVPTRVLVPAGIDPGFAYNVGDVGLSLPPGS
ncbi:MAG: minor capsid protein [Nitratireductor sp.]|nr:minor capsid protein [Nitratireductor sp.]